MLNDPWDKRLVLFFRVLLVQNAVLLVMTIEAPETVFRTLDVPAVEHI